MRRHFIGLVFALSLSGACSGSQPTAQTSESSGSATSGPGGSSMEASTAAAGGEPGSGGAAGAGGSSATGASLTLAAMVAQGDPGRGGKLYEENHCNGCHGTKEKPAKKFPNVFKVDYSKDDEIDEAFSLIKKGKSPMPGFGDKLDDKAVADIVAYMKAAK